MTVRKYHSRYVVTIPEKAMRELEDKYYTYCARRDMVQQLVTSQDVTEDVLVAYDNLYTEAYRAYNEIKDELTSTYLTEVNGNAEFSWNADFHQGVMYITYVGKTDPKLPVEKYVFVDGADSNNQ